MKGKELEKEKIRELECSLNKRIDKLKFKLDNMEAMACPECKHITLFIRLGNYFSDGIIHIGKPATYICTNCGKEFAMKTGLEECKQGNK